jgi:hypothetical protein
MPTTQKPPYKPGDPVVYDQGGEWCLLQVSRVVRRGNHRDQSRRWVIYVLGSETGYYESELKPYKEENDVQQSN